MAQVVRSLGLSSLALQMLMLALGTRIILAGINWYTIRVFPPMWSDMSFIIGGWAIWDTGWYNRIAIEGYGTDDPPDASAFFPLFPLLIRSVVELARLDLTHQDASIAAVLIANLCFFAMVPLFATLVHRQVGEEIARSATILLLISPFSFFLNAGYTESLFLLLVVLTFLFADKQRFLIAALCAALAGATRSTGAALIPALLFMLWQAGVSWHQRIAVTVIASSGLVAFSGYLWWKLGDPLGFLTAQQQWGGFEDRVRFFFDRIFLRPETLLYGGPDYLDLYVPVVLLNLTLWIISLGSLYWVFRKVGGGIAIFTALVVAFHGSLSWISLGRYLLPAVGVYIVVAMLLERIAWRETVQTMLFICSASLLVMLMIMFGHGHWVI